MLYGPVSITFISKLMFCTYVIIFISSGLKLSKLREIYKKFIIE